MRWSAELADLQEGAVAGKIKARRRHKHTSVQVLGASITILVGSGAQTAPVERLTIAQRFIARHETRNKLSPVGTIELTCGSVVPTGLDLIYRLLSQHLSAELLSTRLYGTLCRLGATTPCRP